MSLTLHAHPLSSFCQKVLIALYENDTPFTQKLIDLGSASARAEFAKLWPILKMPVLQDDARGRIIPETSIIIEYLQRFYPGKTTFIPDDTEAALDVRLRDRFFDLYVNEPMQAIVGNRLRPADQKDPLGVARARERLSGVYAQLDRELSERPWACGDTFTMADCAAAPALFYAEKVHPFKTAHKHVAVYFERPMQRPSFARAVAEARPFMSLFPQTD
jgi:glutathione S-transferase